MPRPRQATARHRTDTQKWEVYWRDTNGKQRRQTCRDQNEADAEAQRITAQLRGHLPPAPALRTLGNIIAAWWDYAHPRLQPNTIGLYEACAKRVLDSPLAAMYATGIDTLTIENHLDALNPPLSSTRKRTALIILSGAYKYAIRNRWATENPVAHIPRPSQRRANLVIPTTDEFLRACMTIPAPDAKWRSLLLVAAYCGLRPQEQFALTWNDVTPTRLIVNKAVSERSRTVEKTKTEYGDRNVPLPQFVHDALMAWKPDCTTDIIWTTNTGTLLDPTRFNARIWRKWRTRAGIEVEWRLWRHHYASILARKKIPLLEAARYMGHSKFSLFMDKYADLFDEDVDATRLLLNDV